MKERSSVGVIVVATVILGILAFSPSRDAVTEVNGPSITIKDMVGRKVEIPKKVNEIIALGSGSLRLVTLLESTDKVIGVELPEKKDPDKPYQYAYPELSELPSIGPPHGGDAELLAARDPDVIFYTRGDYAGGIAAGEARNLQNKTGIPVLGIIVGDLSEDRVSFYNALELMGKVMNKEKRAEEVTEYIESTIKDLENRTREIERENKPKTYVGGTAHHGSHGIPSTYSRYTPFEFVNARNVAGGLGTEWATVSKEKILEWDPDIIFIDEHGYSLVMQNLKKPEYKILKAVQNEDLYGILPYKSYNRNYGSILANSYYIGKVLYPEKFSDIDPEEKADKIYKKLLGAPVYEEMKEIFGGFKKLELP